MKFNLRRQEVTTVLHSGMVEAVLLNVYEIHQGKTTGRLNKLLLTVHLQQEIGLHNHQRSFPTGILT